jgi:hypothetical protein
MLLFLEQLVTGQVQVKTCDTFPVAITMFTPLDLASFRASAFLAVT